MKRNSENSYSDLTEKQLDVLEAIEYLIDEHGYSPTYQEIGNILKCNPKLVFDKVIQLERKGYVTTFNGKPRTIRVVKHD